MKKNRNLTELEESLCQARLVTDNNSDALRKSKYKTDGWKPMTVNKRASQLFALSHIQERVDELMKGRQERENVDADYVLRRHVEIDQLDVLDIFKDDMSGLKPLSEWPKAWRTTITGIDVRELVTWVNGEQEDDGFLKKIKLPDKIKNLELLGRHIKVGAYEDKTSVTVAGELAHKLAQARARRDA